MITILDDIFKKSTANLKKMEELTRAFGDGIGRAKSTGKDYKEVLRSKVQGGCIVTAEHELDSQQSSVLRYLSISIDVNSIDTGILKKFQDDAVIAKLENRPNMVQEIFGGWIKYLETNFNQIVLWLMTFQPPPLNLKFKRHQQMYRVFCAIAQMILNWGMFSGNIDANHSQNIFNTWHKVIVDLMLKNQAAATVAEPYQQFLITLQRAIATKILPIAKNKAEFENNGVHYIGYSQTTKGTSDYLLNPEKVMIFVKKQSAEAGKEIIASSTAIFKELFERGISHGYKNSDGKGGIRCRYLKRVKLNGHLVEMLTISVEAMEKSIADFLKEE